MEEFRNTFVSSVVICCISHQILNFASYNPCSRLRSYIRKNPNPSTKVQQNSKLNKNMSDHNTKLLKDLTKAFESYTEILLKSLDLFSEHGVIFLQKY